MPTKKKTLTDTAMDVFKNAQVLKESGPAAATLHPGSQKTGNPVDEPKTLGGPSVATEQPHTPGDGENAGAKMASDVAAKPTNKVNVTGKVDSQSVRATQQSIPGPGKDQTENNETKSIEEEMEFELSEELREFIDQMVAEGKSEQEIAEAIEENFEFIEEETIEEDKEPDGDADDKKMPKKVEESITIDMSEHVDALFEGEDLSEDFKKKAQTIFEAAVKQVVAEQLVTIQEAYAETLEEEVKQIKEELSEKVDDYLNFVTEEWVKENEISLESNLRTELTEDFIDSLKKVFQEHYIDIPDEKVNIVEELTQAVQNLQEKLDESIETNVNITKLLNESKKNEAIATLTEGLTDTQASKIRELAEGISFTDEEAFKNKVQILKESYFRVKINNDNVLDKVESNENSGMITESADKTINATVDLLRKQMPRKTV